jgi:hypothetical protein
MVRQLFRSRCDRHHSFPLQLASASTLSIEETNMDTQKNEVRALTEAEQSPVAGGLFIDAPVEIMGKTLHIWASSDSGIGGAYWTRVWDGTAWR